jgi:hypothetical protein
LCIGEIVNDVAVFSPPIFVSDGFSELDYHDPFPDHAFPQAPFLTIGDLLLDEDAAYEGITFNASSNIDGDTVIDGETAILDTFDNCPFQMNSSQDDADEPDDGQGDACECGDASPTGSTSPEETMGNGRIEANDLVAIREYLVGLREDPPEVKAHIERLCSVSADEECDALDAVVLSQAIDAGTTDALKPRCDAALPD